MELCGGAHLVMVACSSRLQISRAEMQVLALFPTSPASRQHTRTCWGRQSQQEQVLHHSAQQGLTS